MIRKYSIAFCIFIFGILSSQITNINSGEMLKYRIHYGFLNAGFATLTTSKVNYNGEPHLFVSGKGRSSGAVRVFFKLDDIYESYININTGLPSFYIRNISEGNYKRNSTSSFNHQEGKIVRKDKLKNTTQTYTAAKDIQDMISSFYYLRSFGTDNLKVGSVIRMNVWIDEESYPFILKVVGTDNIKTKFGRINCLRIIPSVMDGRVFKDKESVTMWVSNDANHIPIQMKAELAVGSLKADLHNYSNLKYPIKFR